MPPPASERVGEPGEGVGEYGCAPGVYEAGYGLGELGELRQKPLVELGAEDAERAAEGGARVRDRVLGPAGDGLRDPPERLACPFQRGEELLGRALDLPTLRHRQALGAKLRRADPGTAGNLHRLSERSPFCAHEGGRNSREAFGVHAAHDEREPLYEREETLDVHAADGEHRGSLG